ncbi:MAG TPA: dTDP-4-dehydrorhamnose 3,5-epimerase [Verrucomicrobia bacterium]|nr:MAG: dTDP-4-dehydrorhamnose 3,5-epimerase [Lentisphaerae bacterium GWF2_57_35]HBA85498.1 dTDP-4-dehydrorhamnose 3,5-epimerase [Verrucomicrobiota bacterium]
MDLLCEKTSIPDVLLITPKVYGDRRGFFMETFHEKKYRELGIDKPFVQDNYSHSHRGTLRGLHYQRPHSQSKLVSVLNGKVYDVAVDIRVGSPTFGRWVGLVLSDENRCQLFIPEGFAHGFCVLSEEVDFMYKCTDFYSPADEHGILWSDPALGIEWPKVEPILSDKDTRYPVLSAMTPEQLPDYG